MNFATSMTTAAARLALAGGLAASALAAGTADAWATNRASPPTLTCDAANSTQASIAVKVCAGATGAPGGFVVRWAQGEAPIDWATVSPQCLAAFASRSLGHRLAPDQCITVGIGELLATTATNVDPSCAVPLQCGTSYGFKGWARRQLPLLRSVQTGPIYCSTLPCTENPTCTYTQGYWKTHGPVPTGNNAYVWPATVKTLGLSLGTFPYTAAQLLAILLEPPKAGNGLVSLAHQLIAAKLNAANGAAVPAAVAQAIAAADTLIGAFVVPPVGAGFIAAATTAALNDALTDYNEGKTGPGHCGDATAPQP